MSRVDSSWFVYIIQSSDDTFYTGITTDLEKRFEQHYTKKGAKFFYGRKPKKIVYHESGHTRSSASKREYELKQLSRDKKLLLIQKKGLFIAKK
jgi:putative endonuclease